jgi:hypothetical protein
VQPNEIPGRRNPEESRLPAGASGTTKRLQMEANIIAHAWLTPAIFSGATSYREQSGVRAGSDDERSSGGGVRKANSKASRGGSRRKRSGRAEPV